MIVSSINGHLKHVEGLEIVSAGPAGNLFQISYRSASRLITVYHTTDLGRELFRVEGPAPLSLWESLKRCLKLS